MQRTLKSRFLLAATCVMALALVAFSGCSDSSLNPTDNSATSEPRVLSRVGSESGAALRPVNLYIDSVISSQDGATLELLDVTLFIPPGAVPNDTLFSIYIPDDEIFYNEFGTHGLVFDVPVTVTMSYRDADLSGIDESTIRIGWLNPRTGTWEDMECNVDHETKIVTGKLNHFSAYALVSD